jgi:lipid-A-disaccharide synthase
VTQRIFISTGEVSGDLQASHLIRALLAVRPDLQITALGGERMAQAGATLLANTSRIGSIGPVESLPLVIPTLKIQKLAQDFIQQQPPDLVIYVDYMAPNINLGQHVRKHFPNLPTVYYIAPQEWVWRTDLKNTKRIINISDLMLAVFPGECEYYADHGANVEWVGHPLVDFVHTTQDPQEIRTQYGVGPDEKVVMLMPASRTQELKYILPDLLRGIKQLQEKLPGLHFWLPVANEQFKARFIQEAAALDLKITYLPACSYDAIQAADLVVGKSGTVNLESAILNVPQLVLYRVSNLTYWIAKYLLRLKLPFASPVNLVTMESVVPEYLQKGTDPENIFRESYDLLTNPERRARILTGYAKMRQHLGAPGVTTRAADHILKLLDAKKVHRT